MKGLRDFRRVQSSEVRSFGCFDGPLFSTTEALRNIGLAQTDVDVFNEFIQVLQRNPNEPLLPMGRSIHDLIQLEFRALHLEAKLTSVNAVSIFDLDCSLAGNPLGKFRIGDKWYTQQLIGKYQLYLKCFRVFDLTLTDTIAEIGSEMC